MNTKQLFVPMALIGVCLVASIPASADPVEKRRRSGIEILERA
jgi:hypothetical protein